MGGLVARNGGWSFGIQSFRTSEKQSGSGVGIFGRRYTPLPKLASDDQNEKAGGDNGKGYRALTNRMGRWWWRLRVLRLDIIKIQKCFNGKIDFSKARIEL